MIKTLQYIAIMLSTIGFVSIAFPSQAAFAAYPTPDPDCNAKILTFPAWYNGLVSKQDGECVLVGPTQDTDGTSFQTYIVKIIINITDILMQLVAYASIVYLMVGGFRYLTSTGRPDKMTMAKQTISHAIFGLIMGILAVTIVNIVGASI